MTHGIIGSARVTAFGTSIVAPPASVITALVIVVSYAGFAREIRRARFGPGLWPGPRHQARWAGRGSRVNGAP
jgi:hypothetical protein